MLRLFPDKPLTLPQTLRAAHQLAQRVRRLNQEAALMDPSSELHRYKRNDVAEAAMGLAHLVDATYARFTQGVLCTVHRTPTFPWVRVWAGKVP